MSETNDALLATARKSGPRTAAAVELLIWLGKNIPVHADTYDGSYVDTSELYRRSRAWSGGERRVTAVALSLLEAGDVDLTDVIGGTGGEHRRRIIIAIVKAAGMDPAVGVVSPVDSVPQGDIPAAGPMRVTPDQVV